jgi:hypothetical protein
MNVLSIMYRVHPALQSSEYMQRALFFACGLGTLCSLWLAKSEIFGNGALIRNGKTSGSYRRFEPYEDRVNLLRQITSDGKVIEEDQSIIESSVPSSNDLSVAL